MLLLLVRYLLYLSPILFLSTTVSSLKCYQTNGTVSYSATNSNASLGLLADCPADSQTCSKISTDTTMLRDCSTNFCMVGIYFLSIFYGSCKFPYFRLEMSHVSLATKTFKVFPTFKLSLFVSLIH